MNEKDIQDIRVTGEKEEEGKLLSEDLKKKNSSNEGSGPQCPVCGGTKTARLFTRTSYASGKKQERFRFKCASCGHGFFKESSESGMEKILG